MRGQAPPPPPPALPPAPRSLRARSLRARKAARSAAIASLLGQLATDTEALDKAQAASANGGKDTSKARNASWRVVQKSLRAVLVGVQGLCDEAPDAEHARAIAAAASFSTKTPGIHHKEDFYGSPLGKGVVHLHAKLPKKGVRPFHDWQMSVNGTWTALPGTNDANTLVENLTPATQVSFRHRTTLKNETSDWSQTIVILVH